jgi:vanillate O-demethylase ferredoxin subunit
MMASHQAMLELVVEAVRPLTPAIKAFVLRSAHGNALPPYTPGAHLGLQVVQPNGRTGQRAYSLVAPHAEGASYEVAVLHEPQGSGGSAWMHRLKPGAVLAAQPPRNDFALRAGSAPPLLIAGGIGITPLLCMARALAAEGRAFDFFYATRTAADAAYLDEARALGATVVHDGGDPARGLDLRAALSGPRPGRHLHVCGPKGMVQAAVTLARDTGWPDDHVHCELFAGALAQEGDAPFEVRTLRSGKDPDRARRPEPARHADCRRTRPFVRLPARRLRRVRRGGGRGRARPPRPQPERPRKSRRPDHLHLRVPREDAAPGARHLTTPFQETYQ